jgi:hypothetical protein
VHALENPIGYDKELGEYPTLSARITVVPVAPGFRLRAQTPAKHLKFEFHPLLHSLFNGFVIRLFRSTGFPKPMAAPQHLHDIGPWLDVRHGCCSTSGLGQVRKPSQLPALNKKRK